MKDSNKTKLKLMQDISEYEKAIERTKEMIEIAITPQTKARLLDEIDMFERILEMKDKQLLDILMKKD